MAKNGDARSFVVRVATLIERFDAVLYPIDVAHLLQVLPEHGWVVPTPIQEDEERVGLAGLPDKGGVKLAINTANKTAGVTGQNIDKVLERYRELRSVIRDLVSFPDEVTTDYVELRYMGTVSARVAPVTVFSRFYEGIEPLEKFANVVDQLMGSEPPLRAYGIQLAPKGVDANRPSWAEFNLRPMGFAGTSGYHFDIIYRHPDSTRTEGVAEHAQEILRSAVAHLEG